MRALIALPLLFFGTIGLAAGPADPAKPLEDPRICRDAAETGTRIRSSECHLKSQWVVIDAERRKQYEQFNRNANGGTGAEQAPSGRAYP